MFTHQNPTQLRSEIALDKWKEIIDTAITEGITKAREEYIAYSGKDIDLKGFFRLLGEKIYSIEEQPTARLSK